MLLSAEQLYKSFGTRVLLDGASLYLERGDKVGVVGLNGAGKSTLLRLLSGAEEPDGGTVRLDPNVRLEYLPQNPVFPGEHTVLEQVVLGLSGDDRALAEYEGKMILSRLGVSRFDQPVGQLSGGERRRVALAAVLSRPCDVLVLDEPTNHLDSDMVLAMVTHDRYFLERIVTRIVEVEDGRLSFYEGNYDKYLARKAERLERERAGERKRQALLRREYQWVMQGPTARGTKSRERLERYEALKAQAGPAEKSTLELSARSSRLGKKTIELRHVTKAFDGRTVLRDFDCMLLRDDRIGIVGANGSGKSTLLNLIAGDLIPDGGEIEVGETVRVGYFRQEVPDMDGDTRVIDYVKAIGNRIETPEGMLTASQLLEQFLFPAEEQWSPICKLSGGEKRRLYLLSVLAAAPNVLLLDEPTNDLDLQTLAALEDYLDSFPRPVLPGPGGPPGVRRGGGWHGEGLPRRLHRVSGGPPGRGGRKGPQARRPGEEGRPPRRPQEAEIQLQRAAGVRDHRRRYRHAGGPAGPGAGGSGRPGHRLCGPPGIAGQTGRAGGRPGAEDGSLGVPQRPGRAHRQPVGRGLARYPPPGGKAACRAG